MQKSTERTTNAARPRRRRWWALVAGLGLCGVLAGAATVIGAYHYVVPGLPAAETIRDIPLQMPLRIFSRDGRLIEEVGERRRILVNYEEIPEHVVQAFIAAEDRRFWDHPGIDYQGILRAAFRLAVSGEISGGGSTLTQQLARDYFLTREQVFTRKVREAFLAYKIEQQFSKEEIFALFVNKMFFGQRAYGVAAAAQVYFGKDLEDINVAEAATLAGVLPAPSDYNPVRSPANAEVRRGYVLGRMYDLGYIDRPNYDDAMEFPLLSKLHGTANELSAPHVAEMVRREMVRRYGEGDYDSAGYAVYTTVDTDLQRAANYAVRNGLLEFARRRGYRGPITTLPLEGDTADLHALSYEEWPEAIRTSLESYASPGDLAVALVTRINDADNSVDVTLQNGEAVTLPWKTLSWAKPFVDRETSGQPPETAAEILSPGDVVYVMPIMAGGYALAQLPDAQSAIVAMDPKDGAVTSLVGGFDFAISKFNRATQAARQPGSSFKPFVYSAALEHGNTPATIIIDSHVVIRSSELEEDWRPQNYSNKVYGEQRMREALVRSMNLASVRLLLENTGIGNAVRHIAPFGFGNHTLIRNGSLALGGGEASPLDMVQAYATFANGGYAVKPYVIDKIVGPDGEVVYRADPLVVCQRCEPPAVDDSRLDPLLAAERRFARIKDNIHYLPDVDEPGYLARQRARLPLTFEEMAEAGEAYQPDAKEIPHLFADVPLAPRIISAENAYLIQDMMRDVIRRGTGVRARQLGRGDLSGKTGTSNDRRDAWFAGFNGALSTVTWVGYDNYDSLGAGEEGSRTALPIWIQFAKRALVGVPEQQMEIPPGIARVRISRSTGCPANSATPDAMYEWFQIDQIPECEAASVGPDIFNLDDDLDLFDEQAAPEEDIDLFNEELPPEEDATLF
ncbi:MAG: PBP1A family penicillin-binding protein [Pseudomonadota bacterium]